MSEWQHMDRRALMQRALLLLGAAASTSAFEAFLAAPASATEVTGGLSDGQLATLRAMAARIIPQTATPGAAEVGVPERLNGMLVTWASADTRAAVERVLAQISALPGDGRRFAELTAQDQTALLSAHDAAAMQPSGSNEAVLFARSRSLPADPDYGRLKDLIVTLYFMSQPALTQELVYNHVPGRWDPSIPVTPETRPWGEASLF